MAAVETPTHPVSTAALTARAMFTEIADAPAWSMTGSEAASTLAELVKLEAQVAATKLKLLAHLDEVGVAKDAGATSTANWYAHTTKLTRAQAHREMKLATALIQHEPTRAALAAGAMQIDQAATVMDSVAKLPDDLEAELVDEAERHLVVEAESWDAKHLKSLGNHLVQVVAPEIADAHTAKLLEREERAAAADTRLTIWDDGHGRVHGTFVLDALHGAMLKKALLAIAAPKHQAATGPLGERRPGPERMGAAFAEYVERYPTDRLPKAGGLNATVVITMTLDALLGGLKAAKLDTGEQISASLARKLACEARIIPAVLGGKSQVLDLGRSRRFHSKAQRIVAGIEQKGCRVDGCDWPPGMSHMHHPIPWSQGGRTDRDNAMMICPPHHARAHDPTFEMTKLPTGKVAFTRRT